MNIIHLIVSIQSYASLNVNNLVIFAQYLKTKYKIMTNELYLYYKDGLTYTLFLPHEKNLKTSYFYGNYLHLEFGILLFNYTI